MFMNTFNVGILNSPTHMTSCIDTKWCLWWCKGPNKMQHQLSFHSIWKFITWFWIFLEELLTFVIHYQGCTASGRSHGHQMRLPPHWGEVLKAAGMRFWFFPSASHYSAEDLLRTISECSQPQPTSMGWWPGQPNIVLHHEAPSTTGKPWYMDSADTFHWFPVRWVTIYLCTATVWQVYPTLDNLLQP